jgi:hypothetical protein
MLRSYKYISVGVGEGDNEVRICIWKEVVQISDTRYSVRWFYSKAGNKVADDALAYSSEDAARLAAERFFATANYKANYKGNVCSL